jgi:hypothetical protein
MYHDCEAFYIFSRSLEWKINVCALLLVNVVVAVAVVVGNSRFSVLVGG